MEGKLCLVAIFVCIYYALMFPSAFIYSLFPGKLRWCLLQREVASCLGSSRSVWRTILWKRWPRGGGEHRPAGPEPRGTWGHVLITAPSQGLSSSPRPSTSWGQGSPSSFFFLLPYAPPSPRPAPSRAPAQTEVRRLPSLLSTVKQRCG